MDIRYLTPDFAVSPQIDPAQMPALREAGFTDILCNRPDDEVDADLSFAAMGRAAEAEGLRLHANPIVNGAMTEDNIAAQRRVADAGTKVLAYCRSGTRSTVAWALAMAGTMPTDAIVTAAAQSGYDIRPLAAQIDQRAPG
ncbi:hypothetical protein OCGS_0622 [Oceaniovalibus guishaninsula JLT2003]|uniref:Beta-lactamase hydrolase-like protein phosphatase-like domain-containing protein n=1 Tax=Oceaniovalibus guishaninsula JLT2003 TaxID=1231392 RepID=K2HGG1_9RHOB|nr:TIGR01244 family sulfur transferase [Oceaniovalibus guishaninsula]EKE45532.1 hypothetical protein OCGS_0622 [Oceaniovalibus guishaninsula JLT2003]